MLIKKKTIQTERLTLKPYEEKDRKRLAGLLMNEEIAETFMIPDYPEKQQYLELAEKLIQFSQPEDEAHLEYGIYLDKELIGFVNDCGFDENEIEIGYVIHPAFKSRGFATEAVKAVMDELWDMGFSKITAGFFEGNEASRKVMEKCGMVLTDAMDEEEYRGKTHRCFTCEICR